jgi:hypothetical protein
MTIHDFSIFRCDDLHGAVCPELLDLVEGDLQHLTHEAIDDQIEANIGEDPIETARDRIVGWKWYDILCSRGRHFFLSAEVAQAMEQANLTGFRLVPVTLVNTRGEVRDDYKYLLVTGKAGDESTESRPYVVLEIVTGHNGTNPFAFTEFGWRGYDLDLTTWDGSDVFRTAYHRNVWVSPRARDVILSVVSDKNVRLVPADEYEVHDRTRIGVFYGP